MGPLYVEWMRYSDGIHISISNLLVAVAVEIASVDSLMEQ